MSIVSKSITKKLIAENIMGKTICRIAQKNSHGLLQVIEFGDRVYAWLRKGVDHAEEPIWTPSFIDVGIWEQAAETLKKPIGSFITIEAGKPLSGHDHIVCPLRAVLSAALLFPPDNDRTVH